MAQDLGITPADGRISLNQEHDFLRSVDIVAVVSEYVTLRRHGREFQGLCPFHAERSPSFSVNPEKGVYYCHGCHEGGNAASFVSKMEGVSFGEAIRLLAERNGITLDRAGSGRSEEAEAVRTRLLAACAEAARFYQEQLATDAALPARRYLVGRGIDRSCALDFGLGYAPVTTDALYRHLSAKGYSLEETENAGLCMTPNDDSGNTGREARTEDGGRRTEDGSNGAGREARGAGQEDSIILGGPGDQKAPPLLGAGGPRPRDRMNHRLIIPIADAQGRTIAFGGRALGAANPKYLNSPDTALFHKSRTLYLLHRARRGIQREGYVVIVEGYLDALMAHHYGIDNVVATLGTAITAQHIHVIQRLTQKVLFALDSDAAGARAVERAAALFSDAEMNIRIASFPEGMDPDAFLRSAGPDRFRETLSRAVGVVEYRMATVLRNADLQSPDGKAAALQECTKIVAGVSSPLLRDRYVDDLARLWVGAQASGETLLDNIQVVRDEISRHVRRGLGARQRSVSHRLANLNPSLPELESEQARAESELLAALLQKPELALRLNGALAAEDFRQEIHRIIFENILNGAAREDAGEAGAGDWLFSLENEEIQKEAARLLAASEAIVNPETTVTDCVRKVKDFDRRLRLEELRRKFDEMAAGNPDALQPEEMEEHYQLTRYFKAGSVSNR
ncbi:MAG TPA: CHC2 zinc finger domain-containing protein [Armatimonadota bacterium]|nr:CHC2 zinc finger domain-containing protein [Armatimonadota bacterium]